MTRSGPRCCERGVDRERGTLTQHYDTTEVDASLLMVPLVGFLPVDDPLVTGTIRAVEEDLMVDGFLHRYRTETGVGRTAGGRAPVPGLLLLAGPGLRAGRPATTREALFDRLCGIANDVGLLSEEYDVANGRMAGNFPQALSHLTLVQAALQLATGRSGTQEDPVQG